MKLTEKQQGHLIMVVVMTIFGLNIPVTKYLYSQGLLTWEAMTTLRMVFAACLFWFISLFAPKEKVARKDLLILLLGGLCGMTINQALFAFGLERTSPVDAPILSTSAPLFALLIAAAILKEPITWKKAGGVAIGILGAVLLVYTGHRGVNETGDTLGNISIVCAAFFYAFYLVITRPLSMKYSSITMMKWMFLISALAITPFGYKEVIHAKLWEQTTALPYLLMGFVLICATFITYMMIPMAQKRIRATTISMYNNMQPIVATSAAIAIGMDRLTIEKVLASILVFIGVYLVTMSKSKADMDVVLAKK